MEDSLPNPPKTQPSLLPLPKKAKKNHIRATFVPLKPDLIPMKNNVVFINPLCTLMRIKTIIHKKLVEEGEKNPPEVNKGWFYNTPKYNIIRPCDSVYLAIDGNMTVSFTKTIAEFVKKVGSDGVPEVEIGYAVQETFG